MSEPGILPNPVPFGKYYLLERINVGGMAEVYKAKAFGVEGFERLLAVKKILSSIAEDESFINMFIDEAKIAGQLNHPNIAQIFDLGKVDGSYFIALEYIGGKDLKTIFERARRLGEKVSIPRICYVIMKVCEGLAHAHHKKDAQGRDLGIVHRDVSPQNVLISYEGEVKIIDFGIAKASTKQSQTQVGILKGKFSYMSPEQVRGLHVDHRSDIFSLGIVLYELLTLERLFLGESDFDTLEKIRKVEMSPPSLYNPHIPKELEDIVLMALARSPEERFQTAFEFAEALERFMRNQGYYFTNKDLAAYMKESFNADIEFENKKLEYYRSLNLQPLDSGSLPKDLNGANGTAAPPPAQRGLSWSDEEMETQIFDRPTEEDVAEEDIVYAEEVEEAVETVQYNRWSGTDGSLAFDDEPPESQLGRNARRTGQPTAQLPVAEPRRAPQHTVQQPVHGGVSVAKVVIIAFVVAVLGGLGVYYFTQPTQATVTFETEPKSVEILINGEQVHAGPTPLELEVPPGPTTLTVKSDGYQTFETTKELVKGKKYNLTQRLEPEVAQNKLLVKTEPPGAAIYLNGVQADEPTPYTLKNLGEGPWEIRVEREGFFEETRELDALLPDGLSIRLKPRQVSLKITSEPSRANYAIYEKGSDEKVFEGRTPDTVEEIDASKTYRVVVERRRHKEFERVFEPGYDAENEIAARLEKEGSEESTPPVADSRSKRRSDERRQKESSREDTRRVAERSDTQKEQQEEPDKPKVEEEAPPAEPEGTGTISVASKPAARVYIDGQDTGRYTPLMNFKIKSGKHKINLVNPDFGLNKTYYVDVKPGESKRIINK